MKKGLFIIAAVIAAVVAVGIIALFLRLSGEPIVITHAGTYSTNGACFKVANQTANFALDQNQPRIQIEGDEGWTNAILELYQRDLGCLVTHDLYPNYTRTYYVNLPPGNYAWRVERAVTLLFPIRWWHRFYDKGVGHFGIRERKWEESFSVASPVEYHRSSFIGAPTKTAPPYAAEK